MDFHTKLECQSD